MKGFFAFVAPLVWTLAFAIPAVYAALYAIEAIYEVPLAADSFRFERPWAALLLPAGLLVLVARGWVQRHAAPRLRISRASDVARAGTGLRFWLRDSVTGMRAVAVTLMALGLMGPQSIHARDHSEIQGIDIMLVMDLSLSMQAADIQPNRFVASKAVIAEFIDRRPNDRIGAVVFGRDAYTLLPLTSDKEALHGMIQELELGMIEGRGTAIGNAIATALNRMRSSSAKSKVLILLTDGESNSGNVSPDQAAEFAKTMQVKIYPVLMGASDEARVQRDVDLFGRPIFDTGNFPVNPELLRQIAQTTGGEYFAVHDRRALERSFHEILNRLERSEIEDPGRVYGELFPAFLWPALVLVGFELLLSALVLRRWP